MPTRKGRGKGGKRDKKPMDPKMDGIEAARSRFRPTRPVVPSEKVEQSRRAAEEVGRLTFDQAMGFAENALAIGAMAPALTLLRAARAKQASSKEAMDALAEVLLETGQVEEGRALLELSIEEAPDQGGQKYMWLGQLHEGHEALDLFAKGVDNLERNLERAIAAYESRAEAEKPKEDGEEEGEEEEGEGSHVDVLIARRLLSSAHCAISELFMTDLCEEDEAEVRAAEAAEAAVGVDDTNPEAFVTLTNVRLCQTRNDDAEEVLGQACLLLQAESKLEEELGDVASAFRLRPSESTRMTMAKLCLEMGHYDCAVDALRGLLEMNDRNWEAWFYMGEACAGADAPDEAIANLNLAEATALEALREARADAEAAARDRSPEGEANLEAAEVACAQIQAAGERFVQLRDAIAAGEWELPIPVAAPFPHQRHETEEETEEEEEEGAAGGGGGMDD